MSNESQILLYRAEDGKTQIQVKLQDETVWLTQAQMAELFQKNVRSSYPEFPDSSNRREMAGYTQC
jgi:hypothetical protein